MNRPNGVALSPDEKTLYVDDSADGLVRTFPIKPDSSLVACKAACFSLRCSDLASSSSAVFVQVKG
jgi:sugar lactone lactonase YvrE